MPNGSPPVGQVSLRERTAWKISPAAICSLIRRTASENSSAVQDDDAVTPVGSGPAGGAGERSRIRAAPAATASAALAYSSSASSPSVMSRFLTTASRPLW